jgi:hypothetical protein
VRERTILDEVVDVEDDHLRPHDLQGEPSAGEADEGPILKATRLGTEALLNRGAGEQ